LTVAKKIVDLFGEMTFSTPLNDAIKIDPTVYEKYVGLSIVIPHVVTLEKVVADFFVWIDIEGNSDRWIKNLVEYGQCTDNEWIALVSHAGGVNKAMGIIEKARSSLYEYFSQRRQLFEDDNRTQQHIEKNDEQDDLGLGDVQTHGIIV